MDEERNEDTGQGRSLLTRLLFAKVRIPLDVIVLIVGVSVVGTAYTMVNVPQLSVFINPQINAQNEANGLVEDVSKLISLPEGEKPLVVNVYEAERLTDQAFFEKTQNGDKILLYTKSRKAILYRPSEKLIIEVGSVSIDK